MKGFSRLLAALSPNCKQATRLQSAALDRRLSFVQRLGLRIHLFLCAWCRRYGQQLQFLRRAAHDHSNERAPSAGKTLSTAARERMKKRLRGE